MGEEGSTEAPLSSSDGKEAACFGASRQAWTAATETVVDQDKLMDRDKLISTAGVGPGGGAVRVARGKGGL